MSDGHPAGNGIRLRLARQARGFSQQQVADMAGVSRQAISAVESGISDPSLRVAIALSRALGLTVDDLFGTDDSVVPVAAREVAPLGGKGVRVTLALVGDHNTTSASAGGILNHGGRAVPGRARCSTRPLPSAAPGRAHLGCRRASAAFLAVPGFDAFSYGQAGDAQRHDRVQPPPAEQGVGQQPGQHCGG